MGGTKEDLHPFTFKTFQSESDEALLMPQILDERTRVKKCWG